MRTWCHGTSRGSEGGRHPLVPIRVDRETGGLEARSLAAAIETAAVVALPHVSNVTGASADLAAIGASAASAGVILVVDGCQALSRGPGPLPRGVSAYAVSAHKTYGPMGPGRVWGGNDPGGALGGHAPGGRCAAF